MKEFKTIIVDDERLAREELRSVLKDFPEINIVDSAQNGEEAIAKIKDQRPDLIFLDISMPGMTGFEMLQQLDEIPHVIFVTAHDEFALKAFEVDALDYLLKPIDSGRLEEAIEKLRNNDDNEFVSEPRDVLDRNDRYLIGTDRVFIKENEKCFFIQLSEIRMIESDGNYVKVYFGENRPLMLRSLNSFDGKLDPELFFRANRKFMINLNCVVNIENWFNGGLQVELNSGDKIEISRRQAIRFKGLFSL